MLQKNDLLPMIIFLEKIQIPESLELFLMQFLKNTKNNVSSKTVIESLAANIIFSVTRRKLLTLTHFVVAMDLHSVTGSRKVTDIVNKLGPCIDYKRERETSQVVKAQKLPNISSTLTLLPSADNDTLNTCFWVNNFDHVVEKLAGCSAMNTTHLMALQQPNLNAEVNVTKISVTRTGKCTFKFGDKHLQLSEKMSPKIEQRQIDTTNKISPKTHS